ncbi:transmembrane protein, putative [Actinidia rufa]|uniref:Transmembrane protein, putative n=1 Tax=Actinidia rufa TaxID=165716 RepID=A0A7J0F662_9ERIC|nr:transmembrane protein, putative [Actinidia rufa]
MVVEGVMSWSYGGDRTAIEVESGSDSIGSRGMVMDIDCGCSIGTGWYDGRCVVVVWWRQKVAVVVGGDGYSSRGWWNGGRLAVVVWWRQRVAAVVVEDGDCGIGLVEGQGWRRVGGARSSGGGVKGSVRVGSSDGGSSADVTPSSTAQPSPTINLTREYTLAIQTTSYSEIWSKIHPGDPSYEDLELGEGEVHEGQQRLAHVLNPSRECVDEALQHARPSTLTRLVSDYFDHSENTSHLCLLLHDSVRRARLIYHDLQNLLDVLPLDSDPYCLTPSQCDQAFDIFLQFDRLDNPFPCPNSNNFHDMRLCFSQLNQRLQHRLCKSRSRVQRLRHATTCSAVCLIGTVVGVCIAAVTVASHALIALVAGPLLPAILPSKITKKEMAHLAQLDAAAKGTYVLHNDLDTIDRLVERLCILLLRVTSFSFASDWRGAGTGILSMRLQSSFKRPIAISLSILWILRNTYAYAFLQSTGLDLSSLKRSILINLVIPSNLPLELVSFLLPTIVFAFSSPGCLYSLHAFKCT